MKGWLDLVLSVEPNARARAFSPLNSLNSYLETSTDGGHSFIQSQIGNFSPIPTQSALNSVGSTVLSNPQGWPGQVAATTDGNTSIILYTTYLADEVSEASLVSVNNGATWTGPSYVPPAVGEMVDPTLTATGTGYIYAAWEDGSFGNWSVDQAVFSPEGLLIQSPGKVSAGVFASGWPGSVLSIAVDAFQRPLIAWQSIPPPGEVGIFGGSVSYTGGFLPATQAINFLQSEADELSSWDFKGGSGGTFFSTVATLASRTLVNISSYETHPLNTTLCNALSDAGNGLYANATHVLIVNGSSPEGCGKTLKYLLTFNRVPSGGWPVGTQGENTSSPSKLLPTLGPLTGNSFLAVEVDWVLESLSLPINYSGDPDRQYIPGIGLASLPTPVIGNPLADGESGNITVLPQPVNPSTASLEIQVGSFPTYTDTWSVGDPYCPKLGEDLPVKYTETWSAIRYYSNVSVEGSSTVSFSSTTGLPTVYLTNLTPNATSTWSASYNGAYSGEETVTTCEIEVGPTANSSAHESGWPHHVSQPLSGSVTTTERVVGARAIFNSGSGDLYSYWNNTMPASATATLWKGATHSASLYSTSGYHIPDEFGWSSIGLGTYYNLSLSTASQTGAWNGTEMPAAGAGQVYSSPALDSGYSCTFETNSLPITIWDATYSNLNGGNATVSWYSDSVAAGGTAWLTHFSDGSGVNITQTAYTEQTLRNGSVEYASEIHGLDEGSIVEVHVFSALTSGCLMDEASAVFVIDTDNGFAVTEVDNPYDSISQTGGGATLYWSLWAAIPKADFQGGTILLWNDTSESQMSLQNLSSLWVIWQYFTANYGANITPINLNQKYSTQIFLNFTYNGIHTTIVSSVDTFTYEKDTTGDGLTDAEKTRGWYVPVAYAHGGKYNGNGSTWVQANPNLWATNGLVNDYLEKEYDLDPQTIDTAGSHMLDTWNLTFNMGTNNHTCPVEFECWFENSTNPLPNGYIGNGSATNFSATGPSSQGDSYSWAAKILWSKSDLSTLQSLITSEGVGWLRAVTGTDGSVSTLTVWGKLSWGANPLVSSTLNDGIADGSRVNPISVVGIQLTRVFGNASGALADGTGYAMKMILFNGTGISGTQELSNYSFQALIDQTSITNYSVLLPVNQQYQFATLEIQVIADNNSVLSAMWLNSTATSFTRTIDLAGSAITSYSYNGNGVKTYWGQISGKIQPVWTGYKVPTWLWLPDDNSTGNGLPAGLERYTGEQSFDLVVVNSSSAISSQPIPLPWGGDASYPVSLSPGLNDFLIPREQFFVSPFGQAVLLGKATAYNSSNPYPALVGTSGRGVISHFGGANWMVDLGAYWQNRAINTGTTGNITPSTETGTSATSYLSVQVMAATQTLWNNTGGIATVSGLYNTSDLPPAVQSVVTLNVTNQTNLDLLIAALYDNTTGGASAVNGTFQSITFTSESLNLLPSVLSAIPNIAVVGDGLYGAPLSVPPPPPSSAWGNFWNAVTSVVETPLGAILSLATIVWTATAAAMTYLNHIAHEALALGGQVLARVAGALVAVGKLLLQAFDLVLKWIIELIQALLRLITNVVVGAVLGYVGTLWSDIEPLWAEANASQSLNAVQAGQFISDIFGNLITVALLIGAIATVALMVVEDLSLGAAFLSNLVVGLIVSAAFSSLVYLSGNLIPSAGLLTTGLVSSAWWVYNATGGGIHLMIAGSVTEFLTLVLGAFGAGLSVFQALHGDWNAGIQSLKALGTMWSSGGSEGLFLALFQTVSLALDIASIVVGAIGILQELLGQEDEMASVIGIVLGIGGVAASALILSDKTSMSEVDDQYKDGLWLGVGLGFAGLSASLTSAAL